jgi:hypothetical protein
VFLCLCRLLFCLTLHGLSILPVIRYNMSLLSILMLIPILHGHRFRMVLLLFSMCLQSSSWQISSRRFRLVLIINFTSPNSVLLIHHEFERGIRYVLAFSIIVRFFVYSPPPVHVYIRAPDTQMNASVIHNMLNTKSTCKISIKSGKFLG